MREEQFYESRCCKADIKWVNSDECTGYAECRNCGKPCDITLTDAGIDQLVANNHTLTYPDTGKGSGMKPKNEVSPIMAKSPQLETSKTPREEFDRKFVDDFGSISVKNRMKGESELILGDEVWNWHINQLQSVFEEIEDLVGTHTEHNGQYCDTGEDMEWSCRSECVEMAIERIKSLRQKYLPVKEEK